MCSAKDPISGKSAGSLLQNANGLHGVSAWLDPGSLMGAQTDPSAAEAAKLEAQRQAEINAEVGNINKLFAGRAGEYSQYGTDTLNLLKQNVDSAYTDKSRALKFGLLRSGNIGGSEDIAQHGLLSGDYTKGILDASNQAQGAEEGLKAADAGTKTQLIGDVLNGLSATTANQDALLAAQGNLSNAKSTVVPETADAIFGDLSQNYLNQANAKGQQAANGGAGVPNTAAAPPVSMGSQPPAFSPDIQGAPDLYGAIAGTGDI